MNKQQQRLLWCLGVTVVASAHGRFRGGGGAALEPFGTAPVRTDGCPWENDPVECRFPLSSPLTEPSTPRIYSSICFASRTGYEIEHCRTHRRKGDTEKSESSLTCLSVTELVCKSDDSRQKKFANLCLAQVSGYRAKDCTIVAADQRRLRNLQSDAEEDVVFCPMWYQPVYCTLSGIQFPSDCEAGAAGYSLHDCTVPEGGGDPTAPCPTTGQGVVGPVSCNGTTYDSICLASAANHTPTQDCSLAVVDSDSTVQTKSTTTRKCATSGKLQCGKRGRAFDNFCLARKAGFTRKKCQSI
jgi:hypothetical protein